MNEELKALIQRCDQIEQKRKELGEEIDQARARLNRLIDEDGDIFLELEELSSLVAEHSRRAYGDTHTYKWLGIVADDNPGKFIVQTTHESQAWFLLALMKAEQE